MNSGIKKFFSATELRFGLPFLLAFATIPAVALSALLSSCGNGSSAHSMGDPTVGTLVTEGNMTVGRSLHTATLLPTGEVLLVGGGTPASWPRAQSRSSIREQAKREQLPR